MTINHVEFEQQNHVFNCPPNFADCSPLHVYRAQTEENIINVSVWELDDKAIEDIVKTRRLYLYVFGSGHQPVSMGTESPFVF